MIISNSLATESDISSSLVYSNILSKGTLETLDFISIKVLKRNYM